jgi:hypothetical protein
MLLCYTQIGMGAIFQFLRPTGLTKDNWFPLTGFFRSMYARKELVLDRFPVRAIADGYIIHEPFWDTRQVVADDEGVYLFFPRRKNIDPVGKDINSIGEANMAEMESRFRISLYGPEIAGATSFGYLEFDFIGTLDFANTFRDRLAFFSLTWQDSKSKLMFGQFYNPARLAHLDLDPKVVAFNVAAPIHPDAFNPQFRFTQGFGNNLHMLVAAYTQLSQVSLGPIGPNSVYLRRSRMPDMHVQIWAGPEDTTYILGVAGDVKRLIPRLVTNNDFVAHESITSWAFFAFAKYTYTPLSIRSQLSWAQNGADYHLLGGYAVKNIDPITDHRTYTNITFLTYWIDLNIDKKISPGLFCGVGKNLSTNACIIPAKCNTCLGVEERLIYALGADIHNMIKIMPRIRFHFKPMTFAAEVDWSWIRYGCIEDFGCTMQTTDSVSNVRILLATYFYF